MIGLLLPQRMRLESPQVRDDPLSASAVLEIELVSQNALESNSYHCYDRVRANPVASIRSKERCYFESIGHYLTDCSMLLDC